MSRPALITSLSTSFHPSLPKQPKVGRKIREVPTTFKKHTVAQSIHAILPVFPQELERLRQTDIVADVRKTLLTQKPLQCITMIDEIQRLTIDYHFQDEIEFLLDLHSESIATAHKSDLFSTALNFRLIRQHGRYFPPSSIFHEFIMNHKGRRVLERVDEVKGLLALHEASYFGIEGEDVLDEVCSLSKKLILKVHDTLPLSLRKEINHSLQYPIHKNLPRIVLRNYLESREGEADQGGMSKILLELAKTDYNCVQAMYRQELLDICRWWKDLSLVNALYFARDNYVEWYMCSLFILPDPRFSKYRILLAKSVSFIYLLDDLFDVYGTADQLNQFTLAIKGWDAKKLEGLPHAMKVLFFALSDMLNEASDMIIKEQGWNPSSTLRKLWAGLCDSFLEEHRWFASSQYPTSQQYLRNGIITTGVPLSLGLVSLMLGEDSAKNTMDEALSGHALFLSASAILRLSDDLGSKIQQMKHKGHDGCYVDYYMKEVEGASFQDAVDHVRELIAHEWKAMNKECLSGKISHNVRSAALNLARMSQWMYPDDIRHHGATEVKLKSFLEDIKL